MKILGVILVIVVALAAGGFVYLNQSSGGMVGFSLQRAIFGNSGSPARLEANGISLYYETYGEGDPVLLLHGDFANVETMHHQIRALSKSHRVIVPDRRAHGRTTDDDNAPLTYSLMADDMVALLDALDIDRASVVGWSGGGNDGIDMAIRHPDRIDRLVTYGSNFSPEGVDMAVVNAMAPDSEGLAPFRDMYERAAPDPDRWPVFVGKMKAMWQAYPAFTAEDLATIQAPTLIMAGEHDLIPHAHTEALAAGIPNARLVIVEGQDHFAPLMAPKTVNPDILAFLE
ncbi:MAG: alpha/beta hydrolase [Pseudomonadota bacterium]